MTIQNIFRAAFNPKTALNVRRAAPSEPVAPGLYHFMQTSGKAATRFHLRVENDGAGLLLANATAAAHLSPTGVIIAKSLLEGVAGEALTRQLRASFRGLDSATAQRDVAQVQQIIGDLASPEDNYPILNLADSPVTGKGAPLIAPWRADVPLASPEVLRPVIERLWAVGIPHVTYLIGPKFDRTDLVAAIQRAEDTGLLAGVRGRASDLDQPGLIKQLAQAGVDHVDFYMAAHQSAPHDALMGAGDFAHLHDLITDLREREVCPVAVFPLVEATLDIVDETLAALHTANVVNVSFFAIAAPEDWPDEKRAGAFRARGLPQVATWIETTASAAQVRYLWEPPVQRDPSLPLAAQAQHGPRCAGDASARVESDGRVIPARGPATSAGNLLTDAWENIWNHAAFRQYRERIERLERCEACPGLALCAAECVRESAGWAQ